MNQKLQCLSVPRLKKMLQKRVKTALYNIGVVVTAMETMTAVDNDYEKIEAAILWQLGVDGIFMRLNSVLDIKLTESLLITLAYDSTCMA